MKEYIEVNTNACCPQEDDWLEISYAKRKYVKPSKPKKRLKVNLTMTILVVCLVAIISLTAIFWDSELVQDAKNLFVSTIFNGQTQNTQTLSIPAWWNVENVENGVVEYSGGRVALCLMDGEVSEVTESSVTVKVSDSLTIVYGDLEQIYVSVGDLLSAYDVIAKYDSSATFSMVYENQVVQNVVASLNSISWSV